MSKTIIISNRLPVKITKENGAYILTPSEGGLATGLGDAYKKGDMLWLGWPGIDVPLEDEPEIIAKLAEINLVPVFLTQEDINLYYEGLQLQRRMYSPRAIKFGFKIINFFVYLLY